MKKFYRIILLIIVFVFLSTYNSYNFNTISKKDAKFFSIQNIIITNNYLVKKDEVNKKLSQIYNKNIFLIKRKDIENPIEELNFLDKIEVKKKYPNTIIIKIIETKPVAILYQNKIKHLIDSSSNLILFDNSMNFNKLPSIFGEGAENDFIFFFNLLKNNNFPTKKIKKFYFFQIGRWDLKLTDDKIIKFPHNNIKRSIKKYIELLDRKDFENYKIIDLRVEGKIIVE